MNLAVVFYTFFIRGSPFSFFPTKYKIPLLANLHISNLRRTLIFLLEVLQSARYECYNSFLLFYSQMKYWNIYHQRRHVKENAAYLFNSTLSFYFKNCCNNACYFDVLAM